MMTKNKMIGLLLVITALTAGILPVFASTNQLTAAKKPMITNAVRPEVKPANGVSAEKPTFAEELPDLDKQAIDEIIDQAIAADEVPEDDASIAPPLWYLNSFGVTMADDPMTDAASSYNRIRLQLLAEKIKHTEFGAVYEILWARVTHDGEKHSVVGYALLDGNGIFYMKLDGDVAFCSIGRVHPFWFGVRVSMKGFIVDDGITYSHRMRGWGIPLNLRHLWRIRNSQQ
jgi:hypothetical protein